MSVLLNRQIFQGSGIGNFHEQRVCVKFSFKLGKTYLHTFEMLKQAFEDKVMNRTQTHELYKRFTGGQTSIEYNKRSRQRSASKNEENIQSDREVICSNRPLTIPEVGEEGRISKPNMS